LRYGRIDHSAACGHGIGGAGELPVGSDLGRILSLTLTWSSCQQKHGSYKQEEQIPFLQSIVFFLLQ